MTCEAAICVDQNEIAVETITMGEDAAGILIQGSTIEPGWVRCSAGSPLVQIERNSDGRRFRILCTEPAK